ncbi:50S ribosomal protein L3 [Candidatus Campbellbacteria bacterium RIFCSPLOWO2_01_FULL_34_15]|jgi:large subunit ribosomal protein L3|uniref:Large ribosomal subunit protein uL3 n=2 Tax=Candidatus Campbelliibacteriota TaxID=1752727 RepID=A0A1F5EMA3_9BACT|nr:MAG: Ribosomal protein L3, large subunit ribosomal protein L3 [Candidatus Campbellbacteria bacterium GW2011_OD1_34_28]KKP74539.1 MAG: 50S ribosomal protein L3 [Candidatus Campbellbacteria bacterium GW2011_GWD2_35_24]KKP76538.1 MAG: 50S ribosomal protein L3 [Candidatus Campbellbacteria bacterium GW2011_GWC1_35_31]KKP78577.1 MAG: 50S ribosomal protein L3 [Candidatus Campbellbacteria bacterium GW2011_GWD1_35_49]OGD68364.1 MAG: 50S ribosomal protein L3 [Candidatus Campbellbacteria bacterium RIFC
MKFILGTKEKMTQTFDKEGVVYPVTVINAGPIVVTQIKDLDKDGYEAIQIGYGERHSKNINKPLKGHLKDLGNFKYIKEFEKFGDLKLGDKIDVSSFAEGDSITISSISKGKGFQGVVKRHGFKGGPRTHGQKHSERKPGSIGAGGIQRVFKGLRMAGRMGSDRITVKNLKVVQVDKKNNILLVRGAVPGRKGTLVEIVAK